MSSTRNQPASASRRACCLPRALELGETLAAGLSALGGPGTHVQLAGSARRRRGQRQGHRPDRRHHPPRRRSPRASPSSRRSRASRSAGKAGARARTHSGVGVDLRIAEPEQLGNLLQHFTGSGAHNAALREAAVRAGLHVSEYGILDDATGATETCATEQRGLSSASASPTSSPSCARTAASSRPRADGDAAAADRARWTSAATCTATRSPPTGTTRSRRWRRAARERGYEYLAITDHSASHGFGNDVSPEQLRRQIELVREANERLEGIELLAGSEVNILPDGSLDYEDELLARARLGDRERPHLLRRWASRR